MPANRNITEDTASEKLQSWQGALENYTFTDANGGTELFVGLMVPDEFKGYMEDTWPKALMVLKEMCQK